MASGGHLLLQQKPRLESKIRANTNDTLKEICRAYGYAVSGVKVKLVQRCLEILDTAVQEGNVDNFNALRYRIENQGRDPPSSYRPPGFAPVSAYEFGSPSPMAPQRGARMPPAPPRPSNGKFFKSSPFYELLEPLVPLQDLPEMPQNRHTVRAQFSIRPETAQQIRNDSRLKIMMYCGLAHQIGQFQSADVAFPGQIEIKINDQEVKGHNFKGLKNKPGTTKPADITSYVRKFKGEQNLIAMTYALTNKRYAFIVHLVRYHDSKELVDRVTKTKIVRKQTVLENMSKTNADDDIAATSFRMSLKDPISTIRIKIPMRSSHCTHYQCFDGTMFMALQEQAPQWQCPVCSKTAPFDSLCVDEYFKEILAAAPESIEKVDVEPNGKWTIIKEEDESQPGGTASKGRASYDDDFDDLVELDPPGQPIKRESLSQAGLSSAGRPAALDTPPLSSREASVAQSASSAQRNKRPQSAVVDLTLSDDEDEPPRPAKRTHVTQQPRPNPPTSAYNTPNSMPEPRLQLPTRQPSNSNHDRPGQQQLNGNRFEPTWGFDQQPLPAYDSISPPNNHSPAVFGQASLPSQHNRVSPLPLPQPQIYQHNNNNSSSFGIFPPNSPFNYSTQQSFGQPNQQNQQNPNQSSTNISAGGLRLPPMQPQETQYQQRNPWSSSPPSAQNGWRSDGQDYNFYDSAPPG